MEPENSVQDTSEFDDELTDEALDRCQDLSAYALCGSGYCGGTD